MFETTNVFHNQCFYNINTGDRIIDHLKKWLDPETNLTGLDRAWLPGQEVQVAQAMLDTFHLLPQAGVRFLESQGRSLVSCAKPCVCVPVCKSPLSFCLAAMTTRTTCTPK